MLVMPTGKFDQTLFWGLLDNSEKIMKDVLFKSIIAFYYIISMINTFRSLLQLYHKNRTLLCVHAKDNFGTTTQTNRLVGV